MPFIDSHAIRRVEWRDDTLSVWFADGDRYDYMGVPQRVYGALLAAGSAGVFFQQNIRDAYPFRRIRAG